jgi:tRNA(Ile)-lysidine synthase TilS/MesJ
MANPSLCRKHFISYFEKKVLATIRTFCLFSKKDRICVAVSGGKDSMSLLFLLRKYFIHVSAAVVDEGIFGYREHTLSHVKKKCAEWNVSLHVVSFKEMTGKTLDEHMLLKEHPCTVCGKLRREMLNACVKDHDVLALGHNLDDEAQTVLMNLFACKDDLAKAQLPRSESRGQFARRVKPFCMMKEKEVMLYAVLNSLAPPFVECPYMRKSLRNDVRDALNEFEKDHPGTKVNVFARHLAIYG